MFAETFKYMHLAKNNAQNQNSINPNQPCCISHRDKISQNLAHLEANSKIFQISQNFQTFTIYFMKR